MTNDYWSKDENYSYLAGKTSKNWPKGWAWEFIRRNPKYREAYASFHTLQKEFGVNWRKHQIFDTHDPPLLPNETHGQWCARASALIMIASKLSPSQVCARQWGLSDIYDPNLPYNPQTITFNFINQYPMFYGLNASDRDLLLHDFIDLKSDLSHLHGSNTLLVAIDLMQPLKAQLAKVSTFANSEKKYKMGEYKIRDRNLEKYVRLLDAIDAKTDLPMTKVAKVIGIKGSDMISTVRDYKDGAIAMRDKGYKGFLRLIETA